MRRRTFSRLQSTLSPRLQARDFYHFAAGTRVVWDVDTLRDGVVRVYRASDPTMPTVYRKGDRAEADPAVPGWSMPVDDLFLPE